MFKTTNYFILLCLATLFWSCATQGTLTGGEPDEDPPVLITEKSTPNFQTNFSPSKFELLFDEFIEVKNTIKEVGISPPLNGIPKITSRGKKLLFEFPEDEKLKEDVTYTINFGSSIKDYTEGNVLQNFKFVFATGDKLDSLSVSGSVKDAYTGETVEDALIMLYDNDADTSVYTERPLYYAKSDGSGNFDISNIKQGRFSIYAIQDENLNYTWDEISEPIAFIDSSFVLTDSFSDKIDLLLSAPISEPEIISHETSSDGKIKIALTTEPITEPEFRFSTELDYHSAIAKDSLHIWYDTTSVKSLQLYMLNDTLKVKPKKKKSKKPYRLSLDSKNSMEKVVPGDTLALAFDYPIIAIDKDSISIRDTADVDLDFEIVRPQDLTQVHFHLASPTPGIPHSIILRDSSLQTYNGIYNDSLDFGFSYLSLEELGIIHLSFDSIDLQHSYVLQLRDMEEVLETVVYTNETKKHTFANLLPKTYNIVLIEDLNNNGRWDPGNYYDRLQAEKIYTKELDKLKENWELELDLSNMIFNTLQSDDIKGR